MISVAEADRLLAALTLPSQTERVTLSQAVGRVLAEPAVADRDGPPFDRVAMDGYAVATGQPPPWTVGGFQAAGRPPLERGAADQAIEVATGAVLPRGCTAVVPYEATVRTGQVITLLDRHPAPEPYRHVHRQGSDYRQGDVLLPAGTGLRSPHLHTLATVGLHQVPVIRRPVWALAATGDELVEVTARPQDWQIRRSNTEAISGEAAAWGLAPREGLILADEAAALRRGIETLLPGLDVLVLTGGVSAGALDLVPGVMADLGARTVFHRLAQRPGKPLWCGVLPGRDGSWGTLVFGLPGNPVSSLFAFRRYVLPWLLKAEGRVPAVYRLQVSGLTSAPPGQTVFLPWSEAEGVLDWAGSGNFHALTASSGVIEVNDEEQSSTNPLYYPWGGTCGGTQ